MAEQPVLVEGLVRRFGEIEAVAGVDLHVDPGEVFGFLGPNGAGKSTIVRVLVTLLRPTAGRARVAGFDVATEGAEVRRRIGVALQDAAIDPLMTGRELLDLQATLHGLGRARGRQRGDALLERVGLTAASTRRVGTYSGGMRRRLDLALALVHEPEVLFLDEPTTGLDPSSRANVWDEIRELNRAGTTVFLTTQYLEEADQLAGRIAIIDHGRIVREGSPHALKAELSAPMLRVTVADRYRGRAESVLARVGQVINGAGGEGPLTARFPAGAAGLAEVVRAFDAARITPETLELVAPSLDDVFAAVTGGRLEGAAGSAAVT